MRITDKDTIWREFIRLISENRLKAEKIKNEINMTEPLLAFAKNRGRELRSGAEARISDIFSVNDKIHYLVNINGVDYCFSMLIDNGDWYFHHVECIYMRLDSVTAPTSEFPDIPELQKNWIRQETDISRNVRLYNHLKEEKDREFALSWFHDGAGYFMAACAWIPFLSPEKAFILYVCWEQANLIGNQTSLELMEDDHAVIKTAPMYIEIYRSAGHLRRQIEYSEYMDIFESVWHDRAIRAGWKLDICYPDDQCVFDFTR